MTTTKSFLLADVPGNAAPPLVPPGNVLPIAIEAFNTIATEAQQAVKRLEGLNGGNGTVIMDSAIIAPPTVAGWLSTANVPNGTTAKSGRMNPGEVLHPGDSLTSASSNYMLAMQTDGNLVLYSGSSALWSSNTFGKPVAVCIMQGDGNLVLYDRSGQALWASNTSGQPGAHLEVQNDGNVVIYLPNGAAVWATNTVYTIGSNTLIYRSRFKRWTNIPFFGTKGNDVILVKLPAGASLKSVCIAAVDANASNPDVNSPIGTGVGNAWDGARLTNVQTQPGGSGPGFVAVAIHWYFSAFSDAEYSISVWATGPTAYPVVDNGILLSANMDSQIVSQTEQWFENGANLANLVPVAAELAAVFLAIATGGAAAPVAAAIIGAVMAGAKVALNPSGK